MKKILFLSILIATSGNATTSDMITKCFNPLALDLKKAREKKESFFEKYPNAHATIYGLYHGLGGVAVVGSSVLVGVATFAGTTFALADFDMAKFERKWPFGLLPGIGALAASGYYSFNHSEKILDDAWTTCRLPKPKNAEEIATASKGIGAIGAIAIPLALFLKEELKNPLSK